MKITHLTFNPNGTKEETTKEVPDDYFTAPVNLYTPTTEERLTALEGAMLAMIGVSTDV